MHKRIAVVFTLSIIISCLSLGLLDEPKIEATDAIDNALIDKPSNSHPVILENQNPNYVTSHLPTTLDTELPEPTVADSAKPGFEVTTDYGYSCTSGDPAQAIKDAIDSLPEERNEPYNIYLKGIFYPVSYIIMEDNINFIGNQAILVSEEELPIFIHDWAREHTEKYGDSFEIEGSIFQDWITLHNVTFQSIHFKQLVPYQGPYNCAIFFYDADSTGWGISDNLNVYDCEFEGFYNCVQGLAINSNYIGNYFHDYSNNAIMFPAGAALKIKDNIFSTPSNEFTVEQYQEKDGQISIQGGIALFFMDVSGDVYVVNNTFVQGINSSGITVSSCILNLVVTANSFSGDGNAFSIDVFPRPWLSSGVKFYYNYGVADFCYVDGIYENIFSKN